MCIALLTVFSTRMSQEQNIHPGTSMFLRLGEITDDEVEQLPEAVPATKIPEDTPLGKAKAQNADAVAWLQIPGTEIDNVVMQSTNNEYYLFRDEYGEKDQWGSYFADFYANLSSPDSLIQNTVLYGHTGNNENPNGQRFSQLFRYMDLDFLNRNKNIYLTVGESKLTFEIFAVFYTDTDFYYIDPSPSEQGFDTFMQQVNVRNEYIFDDMVVTEQDKLLTLSGCSHKYDVNKTGNHRVVVMARLTAKGGLSASTIQKNPSPIRPRQ